MRSLEPRALQQLVRTYGLEGCGQIVALASAEQLMRLFDDDLWRSDEAGREERFDADRFGLWLEVLVEVDAALAARKLVEMDFDFVTAALSRHILVAGPESPEEGPACEVGGYRVVGRRGESWDALVCLLVTLEEDHRAFFSRLMSRCYRISTEFIEDNDGLYEVLTADEQVLSDAAGDRERRREEQGYVAPSLAAAFLEVCRRARGGGPLHGWDPVTAGYFRERKELKERGEGTRRSRPPTAFAARRRGGGSVKELRGQLAKLSRRLKAQARAGTPWRERDNLDVIAILDQPSWAALLCLVDECPVLPRAAETPAPGSRPLRVASGFDFISENKQIARVHEFVDSLPERLVQVRG